MTQLIEFDKARAALAKASSIDEVKAVRDQAEALRLYYRQTTEGLEMQNQCAAIKLRAERKAGEMLAVMDKNKGGNPNQLQPATSSPLTLAELGIEKTASHRWQKVAEIPEQEFEDYLEVEEGQELTTAGLLRGKPHVAQATGDNEWYTPPDYISAARTVMGKIDLDPASSEEANTIVNAARIFTIEDDGLAQDWEGSVWLNPPYASDLVGRFIEKLLAADISEAVVLVNNATETRWFQSLLRAASAVCFPAKRIKFWGPDKETGAPLQGQAVLYLGPNQEDFERYFGEFGVVLHA